MKKTVIAIEIGAKGDKCGDCRLRIHRFNSHNHNYETLYFLCTAFGGKLEKCERSTTKRLPQCIEAELKKRCRTCAHYREDDEWCELALNDTIEYQSECNENGYLHWAPPTRTTK
jgi:hypothetical protein